MTQGEVPSHIGVFLAEMFQEDKIGMQAILNCPIFSFLLIWQTIASKGLYE